MATMRRGMADEELLQGVLLARMEDIAFNRTDEGWNQAVFDRVTRRYMESRIRVSNGRLSALKYRLGLWMKDTGERLWKGQLVE